MAKFVDAEELSQFIMDLIKKGRKAGREIGDEVFTILGHIQMVAYPKKEMVPILDACCGGKMFYFDHDDDRVLFEDIRDCEMTLCDGRKFTIHPDVVADFTKMPFADNSFKMVVFDPPHLLRNVGKSKFGDIYGSLNPKNQVTGYQMTKYGALGNADWRETIRDGFKECFRVLVPGGFLIFKWNETDIKVSEILKLTPEKPVFGHISGKRANTHWICFMKHE